MMVAPFEIEAYLKLKQLEPKLVNACHCHKNAMLRTTISLNNNQVIFINSISL